MEDLKDSIIKAVKERLNSSIFVNFCVSWLIINWKVTTFMIFIDKSKIEYYELPKIFESHISNSLNGFWCPLIISILFSITLPLINSIFTLVKKAIYKRRDLYIETKILGIKSVPGSYYMSLVDEKNKLDLSYNQAIIDYNAAIKNKTQLENTVKILNNDIDTKGSEYNLAMSNYAIKLAEIDNLKSENSLLLEENKKLTKIFGTLEIIHRIEYNSELVEVPQHAISTIESSKLNFTDLIFEHKYPLKHLEIIGDICIWNNVEFTIKFNYFEEELFGIMKNKRNEKYTLFLKTIEDYTIFNFYNVNDHTKIFCIGKKLVLPV